MVINLMLYAVAFGALAARQGIAGETNAATGGEVRLRRPWRRRTEVVKFGIMR